MGVIVVSKEVVNAVEFLITEEGFTFEDFMKTAMEPNRSFSSRTLNSLPVEDLAKVVLGNYEIEPDPQVVVRDIYAFHMDKSFQDLGHGGDYHAGVCKGIKDVLSAFKLEVEGVNK